MAGTLTRHVTIAADESLNTLGSKLPQLVDLATFSNFSDAESGSDISIARVQSTIPSPSQYDVWSETISKTLRVYDGSSSQIRWDAAGNGMDLLNNTAGTRSDGDVVGGDTAAALQTTSDATSSVLAGVYKQSVGTATFGLVFMRGLTVVKVQSGATTGQFLTIAGAAGFAAGFKSTATTTSRLNTLGLLVGPHTGGTAMAYIRPFNG